MDTLAEAIEATGSLSVADPTVLFADDVWLQEISPTHLKRLLNTAYAWALQ